MSRKWLILMMLVLLLLPLGAAQAQSVDGKIDYCAILPEADCLILNNNEAAMREIHSASIDISLVMDMSVSDSAMEMDENVNLVADGAISASIDPAVLGGMMELGGMAAIDAAAVTAMLDSLLTGIEGEISLIITLNTASETTEMPLNLLMEDGVYVFDLASLSTSSGESAAGMQGMEWLGVDLTGAVESMMQDSDFASVFDVPAMNLAGVTEAMTISRLPDSEVNGVTVAVFDSLIDYGKLLEIIDMRDTLSTAYSGMDQGEVDALIGMLSNVVIPLRQYIGLEDYYTYRMEISMDMEIDLAMDIEINDAPASDLPLGLVAISWAMSLDVSDFNQPVDVDIPADAMILPYSMVTQMSGMQMSGR